MHRAVSSNANLTPHANGFKQDNSVEQADAVCFSNDNVVSNIQDATSGEGRNADFPVLLHEIVSNPDTDDCVHWLPCGTHFFISDKRKFAREILPQYYKNTKFPSFIRRLKRWGFVRVPSGPLMGAYFNAGFKRGEASLASHVKYSPQACSSADAMKEHRSQSQVGNIGCDGSAETAIFNGKMPETESYLYMHGVSALCNNGRTNNLPSSSIKSQSNFVLPVVQTSAGQGTKHHQEPAFSSANSLAAFNHLRQNIMQPSSNIASGIFNTDILNRKLGIAGGSYHPNIIPVIDMGNFNPRSISTPYNDVSTGRLMNQSPIFDQNTLLATLMLRQSNQQHAQQQLQKQLRFHQLLRSLTSNQPSSGAAESESPQAEMSRSSF